MDKLWSQHKREEVEPATIVVRRYRADGKPTCVAWFGLGSYERMGCQFHGTSRFGTKHHCMYLEKEIWADGGGFLRPASECPLWKMDNQ